MVHHRPLGSEREESMAIPFTGELMTCVMCGREQRSDPKVESNWRVLQLGEGERYYACPDEFPPDGSDSDAFKEAYSRVLMHIVEL